MRRFAFFDMDGVLADDRHRVQYALAREWGMYFHPDLMSQDGVWPQGKELYEAAILAGYEIGYLTGRRDCLRPVTRKWLKRHGFDHKAPLVMRADHDRRILAEVKVEAVGEATWTYKDGVWLYDDDPQVIAQVSRVPGARAKHCTWYIKPDRMVKKAQA